MGQVPQIYFGKDEITIVCYSREIKITKGEYDQPIAELFYFEDVSHKRILFSKLDLMHDYDFDALFHMMDEIADPVGNNDE